MLPVWENSLDVYIRNIRTVCIGKTGYCIKRARDKSEAIFGNCASGGRGSKLFTSRVPYEIET